MKYLPEQEKHYFELSKAYLKERPDLNAGDMLQELRELIIYHEWKYYVRNNPVISDFEYDQLYALLEQIERENPNLITPDSPTQRISTDLTDEFESVPHIVPMLSLDNSYDAGDLRKFDQTVRKLTGASQIDYTVEPKFDGGSIALIYEDDVLTRAATRGNGFQGEEITPNARAIRSLPLRAAFSEYGFTRVELRGEAVIRKETFKKINAQRMEEGLSILANPRNSATGGLRTKDPAETAKRNIEAFVFQMSFGIDASGGDRLRALGSHDKTVDMLGQLGFKVSQKGRKFCRNIEEVIAFCQGWEAQRDRYPYEIDGMVVKVDQYGLQDLCGSTSHHPRWAIAFKFKAKQATTRLINVEYQVGKVGSVTPVAKLEPVQLAGVTVSSVSLHNADFIAGKDIRIGDTVLVERAGDVIPYIVKSLEELRDGTEKVIHYPTHCPVCQTALVRPEGEAAWRCPNYSCEAQVLQRMIFHVSKNAMDIDGFGYKNVIRFYELGWLKTVSDIYRLDYEAIAELEGFGQKSAQKLKSAIERARANPIHRLIHSLSIHHVGQRASRLLAERLNHVMDLAEWNEEDFLSIPDIGPVVAENVMHFFSVDENIRMLREMEELGVNMKQTAEDKPREKPADGPLTGKTILFTGTLQNFSRKEAQKLAENAGARNVSTVSGNLDILVVGEKAGSKLRKAEALGTVRILSEQAFLELLD